VLNIRKRLLPLLVGGKTRLLEGRTRETLPMSAGVTEARAEVGKWWYCCCVSSNGGAADDQSGLSVRGKVRSDGSN
jgi:hypothetical protein